DSFTVRQGDVWTLRLDATDPDGDPLLITSSALPRGATLDARDGTLRWEVGHDAVSPTRIPITVSDGTEVTTTEIVVDVLNANAAPIYDSMQGWSVFEGSTLQFVTAASDPDDPNFVLPTRNADGTLNPPDAVSKVRYRAENLPEGATFDVGTAQFSWTPRFDQSGDYVVRFTATDDGDGVGDEITVTSEVPISVRELNRRPVIDAIPNVEVDRGEALDIPVFASDPDGDAVTLQGVNGLTGLPLPDFVTFTDNGNGSGYFSLRQDVGDRGNYTLSVIASDDGQGYGRGAIETIRYDFIVSVLSPNDPPVLSPVQSQVVLVDDLLRLPIQVSDLDQEPLQVSLSGLPAEARLVDGGRYGSFQLNWDPTTADAGVYNVVVTVTDDGAGDPALVQSDTIEFEIVVRTDNQTPTLGIGDSFTIDEGESIHLDLAGSDADGDPLTYSAAGLPDGATLDPMTGHFSWQPGFDHAGQYDLVFSASDGSATTQISVRLSVSNVNRDPILAHPGTQYTREGGVLQFTVTGGDFDGGSLALTAAGLPPDVFFEPSTGIVRWTPDYDSAGIHTLQFTLTDADGASDQIEVPIVVDNINRRPVVESREHQVLVGSPLQFDIVASDPDSDQTLRYAAYNLPEGAVLDAETGRVTWIPAAGQIGDFLVDVRATDGLAETRQNYVIKSVAMPVPPDVRIVVTPSYPALPGQTVRVQVIADSVAPVQQLELFVDGQAVTLDENGGADIAVTDPGKIHLLATAGDRDGLTGQTTEVLRVRDPADRDAPVLSWNPPRQITSAMDLIGSVIDTNLDAWSLEIARRGQDRYETIASGDDPLDQTRIATLDPQAFANGFYTLRLSARDISGRPAELIGEVEMVSSEKPDAFLRSDIDATITLGGNSLDLIRQYRSLDATRTSSVGDGWRWVAGETDLQLTTSADLLSTRTSTADSQPVEGRITAAGTADLEAAGVYSPLSQGDRVYLTLPDGRRAGFTFDPILDEDWLARTSVSRFRAHWVPDDGIEYSLQTPLVWLAAGGQQFFDARSGAPYHPASPAIDVTPYRLTHPDGRVDSLDKDGGLRRIDWSDGQSWHWSDAGIRLNDAILVSFVTDENGMLSSLRIPGSAVDGMASDVTTDLHYRFDDAGRLVEVAASTFDAASGQTTNESLHRYGYAAADGAQLATALSGSAGAVASPGDAVAYPSEEPLRGDLGRSANFAGREVIDTLEAGQSHTYAVTIDESQIRRTAEEVVWVRVISERYRSRLVTATPQILGLQPVARGVDGDRTVALFAITRPDQYQVRIAGADGDSEGQYRMSVDVVGDIDRDGDVDGFDSQGLAAAMNSFLGERNFEVAADFNADGAITIADAQLLSANFGFSSILSTLTLPDRFVTNPRFEVVIPEPGDGGGDAPDPPIDPSTGSDTRLRPPAPPAPEVDPPDLPPEPLTDTSGATFGIRDGMFDGDGSAWDTRGGVSIENGVATLSEGFPARTSLRQAFFLPAGAEFLRVHLGSLELVSGVDRAPDALEIALIDAATLEPAAGSFDALGDALVNFAADGSFRAADGVVVGDIHAADPGSDLGGTWRDGADSDLLLQIPLAGIETGKLLILSFDLLGFADADSSVEIDNVLVTTDVLQPPVANTDLIDTIEDQIVQWDLLANDTDAEGLIDPFSVRIVTTPEHGEVVIDPVTGEMTYTPSEDYAGTDQFSYVVSDADGLESGEAFVAITIAPQTDAPELELAAARGPQDVAMPLDIQVISGDIDGSETVDIEISNLPTGATLSAGTRLADGHYRLTIDQLADLTLQPSAGYSGSDDIAITVTAMDGVADPVVVTDAITVDIEATVVEPLSIVDYTINQGDIQRSLMRSIQITFNQDVWIPDPSADITLAHSDGTRMQIPPDRFSYTSETYSLQIKLSDLVSRDGQYFLLLRTAGVSASANRLLTLAAGPGLGAEEIPLPLHQLLGDLDGDNEITNADWLIIRESMLTDSNSPDYNADRDLNRDSHVDRFDFVIWRNQLGATTDEAGPVISSSISLPDNRLPLAAEYQGDAELSLVVNDLSELGSVTVSVDGSPAREILPELSEDHSIRVPLADLFAAAGVNFSQGIHTIRLTAEDLFGNAAEPVEFDFTIDDVAPAPPTT
ncbi:MAG: Ig-like domain-containing protein, partial [Planctomycetota bacterium]